MRPIYLRRAKPRRRHSFNWWALVQDEDLLLRVLLVAVAAGFVAILLHEAARMG